MVLWSPKLFVPKARNAPGGLTRQKMIPNGVKCNVKHNWVSVLRLQSLLQCMGNVTQIEKPSPISHVAYPYKPIFSVLGCNI